MKRYALVLLLVPLLLITAVSIAQADDESEPDSPSAVSESADESDDEVSAAEESEDASDSADAKEDEAAEEKEADDKERKTHKVEPKRLKVEVSLDGTFVARDMEEVALRPEQWTNYEIVDVVEHGSKVHQGQVLIKFDDRKLNEAIADLELDQRLSELAIRRAEEDFPRMEKALAMSLDDADRANKHAREDFDRYTEIDRPMIVKSAEFTVKYYQNNVEYQREELDQLQKMYEADELTEETEEIILKRQRNSVELAEFNLESARLSRDETLNVRMPRFDIRIRDALEKAALDLARARLANSLDVSRARYELEKQKQTRVKSLDRHAKLLGDRDLMELRSPADGIVYYGQCVNGKWPDMTAQIAKLKPRNNVSPGSIVMTVVDPRPVYVTASLDQAKRPEVEEGQVIKVSPPAEGSDRLDGKVDSVSVIPVSAGKFAVDFELDQDKIPDWIVAGMSCKVQVTTYDKADALTVPKDAVHTDEDDEDVKYVWLVDPVDDEAKPERRDVRLGRRSGDDIEIVKGLKKGDVISLEDESKKNDE